MSSWANRYLAFRAAVLAGIDDPIVFRWALDELAALAPQNTVAIVRDRLLVAASRHLSGSAWARASEIRMELLNLDRRSEPDTPARELIAEARRIDPGVPCSIKQLHRILTDNAGVVLSQERGLG